MIYGYARVSTSAQHLAAQLDRLKAAGCERIFHDKLGGLAKKSPQLKKLLATAAFSDTVIIPTIDRLSRDTADLLSIARDLKAAGVALRSLAEPLIDTSSEFADIVLAVLGLATKLEHKRIRERTAIGRAATKAASKRLGHAPKTIPDQIKEAIRRREAALEAFATIGRRCNASAFTISGLRAEARV
ncbi:recombinase family protein [Methylobacterium trifolii]|uniref:DNA-invertase hin n=1 Tax=Methylobacterium trifolii TaxID=1003092 RepID=A0ABQ4TZG7_9HYPH|nr:recombinase family protein [Methylobacterium trifolii]GJE60012.1 DNA-invertase hin [Methylobacterium trifolii]